MPADEESGFTFVDKRRTSESTSDSEDIASADTSNAATADSQPPPPTEQQDEMHPHEGAHHLEVLDRIAMCVDILIQASWIALGLVRDPVTGEMSQELEQAKVAIDCTAYLVSRIESQLDDETRREVKTRIQNLQLNFVEQSKRSQSGG